MHKVLLLAFALGLAGCATVPHAGWIASQGGVVVDERGGRVARIAQRLTAGLTGPPVRTAVIATDRVAAYSFPDGSVYLTRGLVDRATDEEVAAAISHELGHLLSNGYLHGIAALGGEQSVGGTSKGAVDAERKADEIGCALLAEYGIPPDAMITMLKKVAAAQAPGACCDDLCRRIGALQTSALGQP
jgi:predicted Zn-dependent protease